MLYLWMPEATGDWQWSRGGEWTQSATLEILIQDIKLFQGEDAVVFFPSRDVQLIQQEISKSQFKQLGPEGVRYLLEDFSITPLEQMKVLSHFEMPGLLSILGIHQQSVSMMQHTLTLLPVKVVSLLPDFLILPVPENNEVILANVGSRLLARDHVYHGNSIDDLALYLEVSPDTEKYNYAGLSDEQRQTLLSAKTQDQLQSFEYSFAPTSNLKNHPYNVLPKAGKGESVISGYWKACIAVFVSFLLVQFSYDLIRWFKLKKVADQTSVIAIEQYQSWFGKNARLNEENLKNNFEANLRLNKPADTQALQLISRVGPILGQHQIVANRIQFDEAGLGMNLLAPSSDALQSLVQQMNQQGFKAELGNIQTLNSMVLGEVKVKL